MATDEVLIPRVNRLDGASLRSSQSRSNSIITGRYVAKQLGVFLYLINTSSLSSFLTTHLPSGNPRIVTTPTIEQGINRIYPSSPPVSLSMQGQPPSDSGFDATKQDELEVVPDSLDQDLKKLCASIGMETLNPYEVVLGEQIDDGRSFLMNGGALCRLIFFYLPLTTLFSSSFTAS